MLKNDFRKKEPNYDAKYSDSIEKVTKLND